MTLAKVDATGRLLEGQEWGENRLRLALIASRSACWEVDVRTGRIEHSAEWYVLLGLEPGEGSATEPGWTKRLHPDDAAHVSETLRQLAIGEIEQHRYVYRMRHKDGRWLWVEDRAMVVQDAFGAVVQVVGLTTDITDQQQAQRALEQACRRAQDDRHALVRLIAQASHDLRQPLNAISLLLGVVQARIPDPALNALAEPMQTALTGMVDLFEALLDLAKLETGAVSVTCRPLAVHPLLTRLVADYRLLAHGKGLRVRTVACRAVVVSDTVLLERILRNLLANAVRYTGRGSILVGCRRMAGRLRIEVHDTGPGIPAREIPEIFRAFYRGSSLDEPTSAPPPQVAGYGLGLAIVEQAAECLGHRLSVHSIPGRGSCFAIEMPIATGETWT
jgi:PAS domain S-box-containing protein